VRQQLDEIAAKLSALDSSRMEQNRWVEFAQLAVGNLADTWQLCTPEDKLRVQTLLFNGDLIWLPSREFSNTPNTSLFKVLSEVCGQVVGDGAP
jgi:hypothetical protein